MPVYLQSNGFVWVANNDEYKFKSLLFTSDVSNIINSGINNLQISTDLLNKGNVYINNLKYEII